MLVGDSYLDARLNVLRSAQNPDGGWGYFRGKQSWLEPTAYAALALDGEAAAGRAWTLLSSWQGPDGGWRPAANVQVASWATSLCVTLAMVRGEYGEPFRKGVKWLIDSAGIESTFINRAAAWAKLIHAERDLSLKAWPWKPNTSSWVEPTAHALVALKKASPRVSDPDLRDRVQLGEAQLLDVRCRDGGWNYGSRAVLRLDLPSYPETTALALVGLQGCSDLRKSLALATRMVREATSPLARVWLIIALRAHGAEVSALPDRPPTPDLMLTALEALGSSGGNYKSLTTGGAA